MSVLSHPRRAALTVAAGLLLPLAAAAPASADTADPSDPRVLQPVEGDEATTTERAVVDVGHVDLGPRFIDGRWQLLSRDDNSVPPVWRYPDATVFQVVDAAQLPAPDSPDYAFLETEPGTQVHVIPQVQQQDVIWMGWNTQDPEVISRISRGATLSLRAVEGPGRVFLFLQEGIAGAPNVLWDSTEAYPQDLWMDVNTHTHGNWVFTEPGVYLLDVEVSATLVDGSEVSDRTALRFAVGDSTDSQPAFDAALTAVAAAPTAPATQDDPSSATAPGSAAEGSPSSAGTSPALVGSLVGVAVAALAVAVVGTTLAARRRRAAAEAAVDHGTDEGGSDRP